MGDAVRVNGIWVGHDEGVSDAFHARVARSLADLPASVKQAIDGAGAYVWLTTRIVDKYPGWATFQPSGYDEGDTYDCVSAFYYRQYKCAVMAETYRTHRGWESDLPNYPWPLYHELGHALDYTHGRPSYHDKAFRAVYLADRKNALATWPDECRDPEEIGYFTGPWARCACEAFAEACARLWLPKGQRNTLFCIAFANTMAWVREYLDGITTQAQAA